MTSLGSYWNRFATIREVVNGAAVLEHPSLPFLEVNAGYPNEPEQIPVIEAWYAARGRPAVVIVPEGSVLEVAANNAGFRPEARLVTLGFANTPTPKPNPEIWVEQVAWSMARPLAEGWAFAAEQPGWAVPVSTALGQALEAHRDITAYLAVRGVQPVGLGLAVDGWMGWCAGNLQTKTALLERAAADSGGQVVICVALEEAKWFANSRVLEHFSVWVRT